MRFSLEANTEILRCADRPWNISQKNQCFHFFFFFYFLTWLISPKTSRVKKMYIDNHGHFPTQLYEVYTEKKSQKKKNIQMKVRLCLKFWSFFLAFLHMYISLIPLNGIEDEEEKKRESNSVLVYIIESQITEDSNETFL